MIKGVFISSAFGESRNRFKVRKRYGQCRTETERTEVRLVDSNLLNFTANISNL